MKMRFFIILLSILNLQLHAQQDYLKNRALISDIYISGNNTTRDFVILRELPFNVRDVIDITTIDTLLTQGKNNLINLSLFNFVSVTYLLPEERDHFGIPKIAITIDVDERWYYWPRLDISLDDRNLSNWLKAPKWDKVTYNAGFKIYNLLGYNQSLSVTYTFGYQNGFRINYDNITLGSKGEHFLDISVFGLYMKMENVISENNEPYYLRSNNGYLTRRESYGISYTYRPKLRLLNVFSIQYENKRIDQEILNRNPNYWGGSNLKREGIYIGYNFISDQRDNIQYPLNGYYLNAGMKIYTDFSSSLIHGKVTGDFRYYNNFSGRWSYATRLSVGASAKNEDAYIFDRAIGYDYIGLRGYEYYVVDGQHYMTLNPSLRYNIIPPKIVNLNFLPLNKFKKGHFAMYGKIFFDTGYVVHNNPSPLNNLANKFLFSYGVGVDVVAYYDITLSFDYSFNQYFKNGFYISVKSPIL